MLNYSVVLVSLFDGCKDKAKNLIAQHFSNIFYQKVTFCKQFMIFVNFLIKTSGVMRLVMRRARTLEVSGRCHCFSRPLPLLAAAAANIVPVRCQLKRRGLFPAPVWPGLHLSPPFSSHPC